MESNNVRQNKKIQKTKSKVYYIDTFWGDTIGYGHVQRMMTLLWYLNQKDCKAFFVSETIPPFFPAHMKSYVKTDIDIQPDIIIRDKRDSSVEELKVLQKKGRVLVIDDNGKGRESADFVIDTLPNYDTKNRKVSIKEDLFIYGYNFFSGLQNLKSKRIEKDIDFTIYPGRVSIEESSDIITSLLPRGSSFLILEEKGRFLQKEGTKYNIDDRSYAEIILSTKVIITHFGILLYEGYIAGCRLISIDPSAYHAGLSELQKNNMGITVLGQMSSLNRDSASIIIGKVLEEPMSSYILSNEVYREAEKKLNIFYDFLQSL